MDDLGLEINRPYKYLFSFYSRKSKCLGLIKDLMVNLAQIPAKSTMMDIVVETIPPIFCMLLSWSWETKLGGTLQMDMNNASIPLFCQPKRLYREFHMTYMVSNQNQWISILFN